MLVGRKSLRRQGFGSSLLWLIRTWVCSQMGLCDTALSRSHQSLAPPQVPPQGEEGYL